MRKTVRKRLLVLAGTISMGIGIIGIFVPILPTTPFLLLAAFCYARSSNRFYRWLVNNRLFGAYIKNYIEGRGMPLKIKALTIILLWISIGVTLTFGVQNTAIRVALILIALGVTVHISMIKAKTEKEH